MKVELSYKYSTLDREHQFGINQEEKSNQYLWLWFYLGTLIGKDRNYRLYPYRVNEGKILKVYVKDPEETARLIYNKIQKIINQ